MCVCSLFLLFLSGYFFDCLCLSLWRDRSCNSRARPLYYIAEICLPYYSIDKRCRNKRPQLLLSSLLRQRYQSHIVASVLKNGPIVKPYTGNMYVREMLKNFFNLRKAYYLYSETATYIRSRKEDKGNNMEDKRKQVRTELRIRSTNWAAT